jgi:hypothetical protein
MFEEELAELVELLNDPECDSPRRDRGGEAEDRTALAFIDAALGGSRRALQLLRRLKDPGFEEQE